MRLQLLQQQVQCGKFGSGSWGNIIAIKPDNIIKPEPKSLKRVYCLLAEDDCQLIDGDCGGVAAAAHAEAAFAALQ